MRTQFAVLILLLLTLIPCSVGCYARVETKPGRNVDVKARRENGRGVDVDVDVKPGKVDVDIDRK